MRKLLLSQIVLLLLLPSLSWTEELFVHSHTAPMFKTPSLAGEKLMVLDQGSKVAGLKKKGIWQQVQVHNTIGWIYRIMLGGAPPMTPIDISAEEVDQMSTSARKRPSAYASTAAARGLMNSRGRLGQKMTYDYASLKKMESYAATTEETLQFIKEREEP